MNRRTRAWRWIVFLFYVLTCPFLVWWVPHFWHLFDNATRFGFAFTTLMAFAQGAEAWKKLRAT